MPPNWLPPGLGTPTLVSNWALGLDGLKARGSKAFGPRGLLGARVAGTSGAWRGVPGGQGPRGLEGWGARVPGGSWVRGQGASSWLRAGHRSLK